ncbi:hypothetical protein [Streptomyces mirabilis]
MTRIHVTLRMEISPLSVVGDAPRGEKGYPSTQCNSGMRSKFMP